MRLGRQPVPRNPGGGAECPISMRSTCARVTLCVQVGLCAAATSTEGQGTAGAGVAPHLLVVTSDARGGNCASLGLESPWPARTGLEPVGVQPVARHFLGLHYVVDRRLGDIQVIDPATFRTIRRLSLGTGSEPRDIRVVSPRIAYVTLYNSAHLVKIDPSTGETLGGVDLTPLADADGLPEMAMMALHENLLFVQVQRIDRLQSGSPVPPSYLAVVDIDTDRLLDVDPATPGIQGVRLHGTIPDFKMHVEPRSRRLFVSTPGPLLDTSGGIEEIDLTTLRSSILLPGEQAIGDLGAFVMVSRDEGYALGHTDLTASSHLFRFTRAAGRTGPEFYVTFTIVESLAYDPIGRLIFFPDSSPEVLGVHIFDAASGERLTSSPLLTGLPPRDLAIARPTTPGEASGLFIDGIDPQTGRLSISHRPACGAADHTLVWGRLEDLRMYRYSGQACGIGADGKHSLPDPGDGVWFFLVVGNDGVSIEGSYGADSGGKERPEDAADPVCPLTQNLTFACDTL